MSDDTIAFFAGLAIGLAISGVILALVGAG